MANLGMQFNSNEVEVTSFDPIPNGDYTVAITDSDVVRNSANTGDILKLTLEVKEGQFINRKIFDQINLSNPNEVAVKIGREKLAQYCHATRQTVLNDSAQLHGIPFKAKVVIKKDRNGEYDDRNEIRRASVLDQQGGMVQQGGFPGNPQQGGFPGQQQNGGYGQFANQNNQPGGFTNQGQQGGFPNQGQQNGYANQGQQSGFPNQGQQNGFQNGQQNAGGFVEPNQQQGGNFYAAQANQGGGVVDNQQQTNIPAYNAQGGQDLRQNDQNQVVDNSPVPDMQFNGGNQQQGGQVNNQQQPNGMNAQQQGGAQQQVVQKAPWEQ